MLFRSGGTPKLKLCQISFRYLTLPDMAATTTSPDPASDLGPGLGPGSDPGSEPPVRRVPTQARSRRRVERILAAAERLVVEMGVEALSTRDVARVAEVPVASLYQYFADKEDVLLALAERDMAEMDEQVAADVAALPSLDLPALVRATIGAFVAVYRRRPAFVVIYLRGRTNTALAQYGRVHNARLAASLREVALAAGLCDERLTGQIAELAVEVGDRMMQLAYEHRLDGDPLLVEETIVMLTAYLERFATAGAA